MPPPLLLLQMTLAVIVGQKTKTKSDKILGGVTRDHKAGTIRSGSIHQYDQFNNKLRGFNTRGNMGAVKSGNILKKEANKIEVRIRGRQRAKENRVN